MAISPFADYPYLCPQIMKNKTIKTPPVMAELCELSCCPSVLASESKLSRRSEEHPGDVPSLRHHSGKNTIPLRFIEKQSLRLSDRDSFRSIPTTLQEDLFFSPEGVVFPSDDVCVSQKRVTMSRLGRKLAFKHKAMTSARQLVELRHQQRCFYCFCQ